MNPSLQTAIDRAVRMNVPQLPLLCGAAECRHHLAIINDPATPWPARLGKLLAPVVVVVADDGEPERPSSPPEQWACARRAREWARGALIHAAGGEALHYRAVSADAAVWRNVLVVETSSARAPEWAAYLNKRLRNITLILPRDGGAHPVPFMGVLQ